MDNFNNARQSAGRSLVIAALFLAGLAAQPAAAEDACNEGSFIHNYPVHDIDAYDGLFEVVEGYTAGPEVKRPWPFAEESGTRYRSRDFCPADPNDRIVRLFEATPEQIRDASMQAGTLTLTTRDLAAARVAAKSLATEGPRDGAVQGRREIYFADHAGNDVFVWEFPGPPTM